MRNQQAEWKGNPGTNGVLETALYVDNLQTAERFYGDVLGLPKIFTVPGRQLVFRCEDSILLIFDPTHTERNQMTINGGAIPLHGARGAGHMAFQESEVSWPNGAHSIYFRDPAGNSLEFATRDIWEFS